MIDFYIKQLSVTGFNVRPMTLQFQRGANIIYGTSDSGKSYVVECLDFMFGAKTMRLKSSSGYNAVSLTIQTSQGEIYLERRFDVKKESVTIHSEDPRFIGLNCTGVEYDVLDSFWMRLIGISENQTVVTSGYYAHELLKWANIAKFTMLKETSISGTKSAIPHSFKYLSVLLFLLTGDDFADHPPMETDSDRVKRTKGVKEHIKKELERILKRRLALMEELASDDIQEIRENWEGIMAQFSFEEQQLKNALDESRTLHLRLDEAQKTLASLMLQTENHALLRGLYAAQAKRLAFTMEGQLLSYKNGEKCKCPFCGKESDEEHINQEALEATRAEFAEAEIAIHQFVTANKELESRIEKQRRLLESLERKCAEVDERIATIFAPSVAELKKQIDRYLEYTRKQHEYDLLGLDHEELQNDYDTAEQKPTDEAVKFKPKDEFPDEFRENMSSRLEEMLVACLLQELQSVRFEMATMDVSVEWQDKESFGEGYRAFLNTVMAFTLFRYLCDRCV